MLQEYLFHKEKDREKIKGYTFNQNDSQKEELMVHSSIMDIPESDAWVAGFFTNSNSENAARILSEVDDWIQSNTSPVTLTNESSAYFNKTLFPLINDFERRLRKLLYLMVAIHKNENEKATQNIQNLEEKDLGAIFEFLFSDAEFAKKVRQIVKDKTWVFTKSEIIQSVKAIDEVTIWNQIVGREMVPTLSDSYVELKNNRNHVMHAHNIDYKTYVKAKKLYKTVNSEIEKAIDSVTGKNVIVPNTFNETLYEALKVFAETINAEELQRVISKTITPALKEFAENISNVYPVVYTDEEKQSFEELSDTISRLEPALDNMKSGSEE